MILKYIPYSAYQVKIVNWRQPIQAPLNILIIILTDTGTTGRYWREIWHSNCEFEFLMVEYQRYDYYEEIVHHYPRNSHMYSIQCH